MAGWRITRKVIGPPERPIEILPSAPQCLFQDIPSRLGTFELARIPQMGLGLTVNDLVLVSLTRIGLGPNAFV